jgi:hypothetical protein
MFILNLPFCLDTHFTFVSSRQFDWPDYVALALMLPLRTFLSVDILVRAWFMLTEHSLMSLVRVWLNNLLTFRLPFL